MLTGQMVLIDLNLLACYFGAPTKGATHEHRQNRFLSSYGIPARLRIPKMRSSLSGRLQSQKLFVYGSIFVHGLCLAHLSRKSSRHRIMSQVDAPQTLSHGHPQQNLQEHPVRCQRKSRLAYLCRLRPDFDPPGQIPLPQRTFWHRIGSNRLRARCYNNRLMSGVVPLCVFPKKQRCHQAPHTLGLTRQHPIIYRNYHGESPRCQYPRRFDSGTRFLLCYGSRLPGFRKTLSAPSSRRIFCHQGQIQSQVSQTLFSVCRQNHRSAMRSNHCSGRLPISAGLSGKTPARAVLRFREQQTAGVFNKQFSFGRLNDRPTLQIPLESRTLFQVDQATSQDQSFFWNIRECRENPSLDCHLGLCADCYYQKTFKPDPVTLHNSTDFERHPIRESPYASSTYDNGCHR